MKFGDMLPSTNIIVNQEPQPAKANSGNTTLTVETIDNHVYFYSRVDMDRCLALIKTIREIDNRLRTERISRCISDSCEKTPIWLHIHSYGGEFHVGLAIADQLELFDHPVYSVMEGICASAGTLIALACKRRYVTRSTYVLIHQFTSAVWGTHEEFKDEMELQNMLMETLVNFYSNNTKMHKDKVRETLKRDSWFSAAQCLEYGIADEYME